MRISYGSLVFGLVLLLSECSILCLSEINDSSSSSSSIFCIEHERQALLKFKASFKDASTSYRLSSWKGHDCCQWQGIGCHAITKQVVKLDLHDYGYAIEADEVNPSLLELKNLSYLDLSGNNFNGSPLPMFLASMKQLTHLNLSNSNFGGSIPHNLGNLTNLLLLDLRGNYELQIDDGIQWISQLQSLQHLDMSYVNLTKAHTLFQVLNMLPSLLQLHLRSCELHNISLARHPINVTNLARLQVFDLSHNFLESPFLNAFQNMTSLIVLNLSWNHLNSTPLWLGKCNNLVELDMSENDVHGPIPNALRNLTSITHLDLSSNSFVSPIPPWFSELNSLTYLSLASNEFTIIDRGFVSSILTNNCDLQILDMTNNKFKGEVFWDHDNVSRCINYQLEELHLGLNEFSGHLPSWLGKFDKLTTIDLSSNSFIGPIPSSLGNLSKLIELRLSGNHLNGTIPDSFTQLVNLRSLHLEDNNLDGVFPDFLLRELLNLNELYLSKNSFHGVLPANSIGQLVNLTTLDLSFNNFHGNIPWSLEKLVNLGFLDLSYNNFSGVIPPSLGQLDLNRLFLRSNNLQGNIPESFGHFQYLDLSSNALEGSISKLNCLAQSCFFLDLSNNHIAGQLPENISDIMPNLNRLFLGNNLINGSIPKSLCKIESLYNLDLSKNKLSGEIPNCWRKGQMSWVEINLSSNMLTGVIPSSLGDLDSLLSLHLNDNSLQGELPLSMKNLKNLMVLDVGENQFSGTIPTWMVDSSPLLHILILRQNNFNGNIPSQLCQLSRLQILDLGSNNLLGPIPDCIGNLKGMASKNSSSDTIIPSGSLYQFADMAFINREYEQWYLEEVKQVMKGRELDYTSNLQLVVNLDLSNNNFSGSIPKEITALTGLQGLNLSHNHLFGEIPERIGDMKSLESIDFSHNHLSGTIPNSMSKLTGLGHMNLSYNNLSGKIPRESQLLTLDNPLFYIGNPYLCGEPLQKKCPGGEIDQALAEESNGDEDEDGKHDDSEKIWFYFVVAVGYATGFWISIGVLFFKKNWRHAYFRWGEKVADMIYVSIALKVTKAKKMMEGNMVDE